MKNMGAILVNRNPFHLGTVDIPASVVSFFHNETPFSQRSRLMRKDTSEQPAANN
jgi:hypothetical protein